MQITAGAFKVNTRFTGWSDAQIAEYIRVEKKIVPSSVWIPETLLLLTLFVFLPRALRQEDFGYIYGLLIMITCLIAQGVCDYSVRKSKTRLMGLEYSSHHEKNRFTGWSDEELDKYMRLEKGMSPPPIWTYIFLFSAAVGLADTTFSRLLLGIAWVLAVRVLIYHMVRRNKKRLFELERKHQEDGK
jgi:hypothetical protein